MGNRRSDSRFEPFGRQSKPGERRLFRLRKLKRTFRVLFPICTSWHLQNVRPFAEPRDRDSPARSRPITVIHRWTVRNLRRVLLTPARVDEMLYSKTLSLS